MAIRIQSPREAVNKNTGQEHHCILLRTSKSLIPLGERPELPAEVAGEGQFENGKPKMPDQLRYQKLDGQLGQIYREIQALRINQHVFWEVQSLIRNNPNLHKPSTFYGWMGNMYAAAMSAAVRRLVDRRKDTVSFVRLLEQLKKDTGLFSRAVYKSRCTNPDLPKGFLDRDYDGLVGKGKQQPDPGEIEREIKDMEARTRKLKDFVDTHVAHLGAEPAKDLPKFQELDDAIDCLEALVKRYLHLFRGVGLTSVLPTWQYDWQEIFRYPWIEAEAQFKE